MGARLCICLGLVEGVGVRMCCLVVRLEVWVGVVVVLRVCLRFGRFVPWEVVPVRCRSRAIESCCEIVVLLWICEARLGSGRNMYIERTAAAATVSRFMDMVLAYIPAHMMLLCHSVHFDHSAVTEQPPEAGS